MDELRAYRKSEVHGNAYRQPKKYKILVEEKLKNHLSGGLQGVGNE